MLEMKRIDDGFFFLMLELKLNQSYMNYMMFSFCEHILHTFKYIYIHLLRHNLCVGAGKEILTWDSGGSSVLLFSLLIW